jgi:gluconolactonase
MTRFLAHLLAAAVLLLGRPAAAVAAEDSWKTVNGESFYPEGPLWSGGRLLYVEYAAHTIVAWDGQRNVRLWRQEGCGPAALAPYRGGLLVTCYDANTLVLVSRDGRTLGTIGKAADGGALLGPNDLAEDGRGGLYVSLSGVYDAAAPIRGEVAHLDAAGNLRRLAGAIHYANGLALVEGGKALLVAEMLAARVLRFEVAADGALGERRVFARLKDLVPDPPDADAYYGPDGLKADRAGNVYIAQNGGASVLVADPGGKTLLRRLPVRARYVTNLAFGASEDVLYVTAATDPWHPPYPGEVYEVPNR